MYCYAGVYIARKNNEIRPSIGKLKARAIQYRFLEHVLRLWIDTVAFEWLPVAGGVGCAEAGVIQSEFSNAGIEEDN